MQIKMKIGKEVELDKRTLRLTEVNTNDTEELGRKKEYLISGLLTNLATESHICTLKSRNFVQIYSLKESRNCCRRLLTKGRIFVTDFVASNSQP